MLGIFLTMGIQLVILTGGVKELAPGFIDVVKSTSFHAPTTLKLVIEVAVFFIGIAFKAIVIMVFLLIPSWIGLVFFMAKRSREGYYVDVIPEGVTVGNPVDRVFLQKNEIRKIRTSRFFPCIPSIHIYTGRRKITIRKLVEAKRTPDKKPFVSWLKDPAPTRFEIREGMISLKRSLEELLSR